VRQYGRLSERQLGFLLLKVSYLLTCLLCFSDGVCPCVLFDVDVSVKVT